MLKYSSKTLIILFLIFAGRQTVAQISGTVTINSALPTAGTNYQSFSALATVLNTGGINGPLTVNVIAGSGPYNESVTFNSIAGVSATNTITLNGNGATLVFSGTSTLSPATLKLNGTDYFNFYNLKIEATGPQLGSACKLENNADHNLFSACSFSCPAVITASHVAIDMAGTQSLVAGSYNTFNGCTVANGNYGIQLGNAFALSQGLSNELLNCTISNFRSIGLEAMRQQNLKVSHCSIDRSAAVSTTVSTVTGLRFSNNAGILCEANCIHDLGGNAASTSILYGIYAATNSVTANSWPVLYKNNVISSSSSNGIVYGIYNYSAGRYYNNTIYINDPNAAAGNTYGLFASGLNQLDSIHVRNNIFYLNRAGSGNKFCFHSGANVPGILLNNNWYFTGLGTGSNFLACITNSYSTLTALQANGIELNGVAGNPNYSVTNICMPVPTNTLFDNGGVDLGVTLDAGDHIRNPQHPDFGAVEFNTPTCSGAPAPNALSVANPTVCPGSSTSLSLSTLNADLGLSYQWLASATGSAGPWTVIPGANTYTFNTPSLSGITWYQLIMTCTVAGGSSISLVNAVDLKALTTGPSGNTSICKGESIILTASGATSYTWSTSSTSASITVTPSTTTTYTVDGIDSQSACYLTAVKTVSVNECTGLATLELSQWKVYPVPAKNELFIEVPNTDLKAVILRDLSGRVVRELTTSGSHCVMNLQELCAGVYFLQLSSGSQEKIVKVIRE